MNQQIAEIILRNGRAEAESLIRSKTRSVYIGDNKAICIVLGGYKMLVDTRDMGFTPHMLFDGYWEYWLTRFIVSTVKPNSVVADVGANLGYYTLLMAELVGPGGMVHAFEANPEICKLLEATVKLNGFSSRVTVHNKALVGPGQPATVSLFVPEAEPKNATLVPDDFAWPSGSTVKVDAMQLDDIGFERLDFAKIDVEGAEFDVLSGAQRTLSACRPKVVCEVNFDRAYSFDDVVSRLGRDGSLEHVDYDGSVRPLTREMTQRERIHDDWLVCLS